MTFAENLMALRKQHGLSQESLGDVVDVSRQTVSKWELGLTTPELDKLVGLAEYFHITLDELVGREVERQPPQSIPQPPVQCAGAWGHYEYKSQRTLFGLPLVHVNFQNGGFARAKGIIAIGNRAIGLVTIGGVAIGVLLALAGVAIGGVAMGAVTVGVVAFGGVALGYVAVGGCVSGTYALGNLAAGSRLSVSDLNSLRVHMREMTSQEAREMVRQGLLEEAPGTPGWVSWLLVRILGG